MQKNYLAHAFLSFLFLLYLITTPPAYASWGSKGTQKRPPIPVNTTKVKTKAWQKKIQSIGTLVAKKSVMITSGIDGHIIRIDFEEGEKIQKNKTIIVIDHKMINAQLAEAKAKLQLSQINYQRAKNLIKSKSISPSELDTAKANFYSNKAKVAQIQASLDKAFVKAPFSGRMGLRHISEGFYVKSGDDLVSLQTVDPIYVDFTVPETQLADLTKGQPLFVHSTAYPKRIFKGYVLAIDAKIDSKTRSLKVRGSIPNPKGELLPGGFAEISTLSNKKISVAVIPQEAIIKSINKDFVYKVEHGRAVKTPITIIHRTQQYVFVSSGIQEGDTVITEGQLKLIDNAPVKTGASPPSNLKNSKGSHGIH